MPCHHLARERVADHKATLQTQAVNFNETTPHTHTRLASALQHTLPHTLGCSFALKLSHISSHPYLHFYSQLSPLTPPLDMALQCSRSFLLSSSSCLCRSLFTSSTPALTTSTKLTPQARSVESVGGVRCWHFPPPLHWARFQAWTACSLSLSLAPV